MRCPERVATDRFPDLTREVLLRHSRMQGFAQSGSPREKFSSRFDILVDEPKEYVLYVFYNLCATISTCYNVRNIMMIGVGRRGYEARPSEEAITLQAPADNVPQTPFNRRVLTAAGALMSSSSLRSSNALDDTTGEVEPTLGGERVRQVEVERSAKSLLRLAEQQKYATILADPPWRFTNRTGKMAPEHHRLSRYVTMTIEEIRALPVAEIAARTAHLYLWVPNALLPWGLAVLAAWGFEYKSNIVWHKLRKDGGSDGRGVGFYFRNVTEILLFGVRGPNARTLPPGRSQVNYIGSQKREHSRKPDEQYDLIEACSPAPYIELFARGTRPNWALWGNQADPAYKPTWATYAYNSSVDQRSAAD
jgi:N6-adenosine-specific RNA methylase IME4